MPMKNYKRKYYEKDKLNNKKGLKYEKIDFIFQTEFKKEIIPVKKNKKKQIIEKGKNRKEKTSEKIKKKYAIQAKITEA